MPGIEYWVVLTEYEHRALLTILSDYMRWPDAIEVSIDALTDTETTPGDLLTKVVNAQPRLGHSHRPKRVSQVEAG